MRALPVLAAVVAVAGCGSDGDDGEPASGTYDVELSVGLAVADDAADPNGFPGEGSTFSEQWVLDCDDAACTLGRPEGNIDRLPLPDH